ncbi:non-canonical purine NTP pyrophosphatase [Candidatus Woesearchaeota archaeon]|nr:non-canonical purine NTP pyrophosphatase [Candidatus Woesearchaeota archaeon]
MELCLVTKNNAKAKQIKDFFKGSGIVIVHKAIEYDEPEGLTVQETALQGAKYCAELLHAPVFVDDTGVFFEGYNNFPGARAKREYQKLGFQGLFEKIKKTSNKKAYFLCAIAYCEPGKKAIVFEGKLHGTLVTEVRMTLLPGEYDHEPYSRFFIPEGETKTLIELRAEGKEPTSHRRKAVIQLLDYLKKKM